MQNCVVYYEIKYYNLINKHVVCLMIGEFAIIPFKMSLEVFHGTPKFGQILGRTRRDEFLL
jgi:hypothetical protein